MNTSNASFTPVKLSLTDLLGAGYIHAVCSAREFLTGEDARSLLRLAKAKVDFFPTSFQRRLHSMLRNIGASTVGGFERSASGATTKGFRSNSSVANAPLSTFGYYRISESGRLHLISKSEHYHASLGHGFPGYGLVEHARRLGIPNATHNNTRGHITRLAEMELVRVAAGIGSDDTIALKKLLASTKSTDITCVLNLETGSLAAEAALKMMLARFYKPQADSPEPKYKGRIPVFVVMGDEEGGDQANYHGTTILTQTLRGMWPAFQHGLEQQKLFVVRSVRPNATDEFARVIAEFDRPPYKIAGFLHEIILMNCGAKRLTEPFLRKAYALCRKRDAPVLVDEIQSCVWSPELLLFREYRLKPQFVAIGKGFPGGEYAGSRLVFSPTMDSLPQFGALVTNGQEELVSLTYLITLRWAEANASATRLFGDYYELGLRQLAKRYSSLIETIEGRRHLAGIYFRDIEKAKAFASRLNHRGLDISVQTYKAGCPPSALTKLPLIADKKVIDTILSAMRDAAKGL